MNASTPRFESDSPLPGLRPATVPIAFLGTYPPRRCGIATFTRDLARAVAAESGHAPSMILAVTDPGGQHAYSSEVKHEIRQGAKGDYARAAEFVNYSDARVVSVQHEYGIFGGDDGNYILDFLTPLRVPAIVTLHTVLKQPSASQRAIVRQMAKQCAQLVVMSRVACSLLDSSYGVHGKKVQTIGHGIPRMEARDRRLLKASFGVADRRMLLTFGLLSPNKGIETVIRALPPVVEAFPDLVYFVVGATHPHVLQRDGEAYRTLLEREAERVGVRDHVVFRDQFVSSSELAQYLQATDVFVTPYLNEVQVTSGALSYAMGAGAAVVSTPYWHAQELLADGRGKLFAFRDHAALGRTLLEVLGSAGELARMRSAAADFTRALEWPNVGLRYFELAKQVSEAAPPRRTAPRIARASSLPELRLDHLQRMTDDTGIIQHATYSVPSRRTGYCVDDNARALIVALHADRLCSSADTRRLVTTYLSYVYGAQREDGSFNNFMSYSRLAVEAGRCSDDCLGRAIWALGVSVRLANDQGCRLLAREIFARALTHALELGPRGSALALLGVENLLQVEPDSEELHGTLRRLTASLIERYRHEQSEDWRWFEATLTYDNATLPLALFKSYAVTSDRETLRVARDTLEFLEETCFEDGCLRLVGNTGWHSRGGVKPEADEQAIDAAAFVLAFRGAYLATGEPHYLRRMREAFAWFLGENRLGLSLYDFSTAGCRDGLGAARMNLNQGAESTLCFLMSLVEMLDLAAEGLEHADADQETSA